MAFQSRNRILKKAAELFNSFGINAVTNDEISKSLGISKATLYKHFASKEILVSIVIKEDLSKQYENITQIYNKEKNVIIRISRIWDYLLEVKFTTNANFRRDMEKYYPLAWKQVRVFEHFILNRVFLPTIRSGITDNFFRSDTNEVFSAKHWQSLLHFGPEKLCYSQALKQHFIRGLLTLKGLELYQSSIMQEVVPIHSKL